MCKISHETKYIVKQTLKVMLEKNFDITHRVHSSTRTYVTNRPMVRCQSWTKILGNQSIDEWTSVSQPSVETEASEMSQGSKDKQLYFQPRGKMEKTVRLADPNNYLRAPQVCIALDQELYVFCLLTEAELGVVFQVEGAPSSAKHEIPSVVSAQLRVFVRTTLQTKFDLPTVKRVPAKSTH